MLREGVRARTGRLAVALHDVEPRTFERAALIRDWLSDQGVDRLTLLVIPAPDLHPFHDRRPDMVAWLDECRRRGDAIAQHGFQHRQTRPKRWPARRGDDEPEFVGLDAAETRCAVAAGRRVLRLAGITPKGFVAPAYAYTPALRETLETSFEWWATLRAIHRPSSGPGQAPALRCPARPARMGGTGQVLRLDLHPADLDRPRQVGALERVLRGARRRDAVTYDQLAA